MSALGRMVKNTLALFAADIFSKAVNFIFIAILIRHLAPIEYGGYTTIMGLILFLVPLTDLGISQVVIRDVAADPTQASRLLSNAILITTGLSIFSTFALFVISQAGNYPDSIRPLIMVSALAVFGNAITQTAGSVFRGLERMEIQAILNSSLLLIASLAGIALALAGFGLKEQIIVYALISLGGAVVTIVFVHWFFVPLNFKIDLQFSKFLIVLALPIALLVAYRVLLRWSDILILGQTRSLEEVAIYGAAQKTIDLVSIFSASATGALFPLLSSRWQQSTEATKKLFLQAVRFFSGFGIAAAVGLTMLAEPITTTLYGELYQPAAISLQILAWAFFFTVISGPMGTMLLASSEHLKKIILPVGLIVGGNIVLNIALTPRWGYLASSVIFLGTAFATFGVRQWASRFFFNETFRMTPVLIRPLVAGIAMGATLYLSQGLHIVIAIPLGAAVFLGVLAILGEFKEEPYRGLLRLLSSKLISHPE